MLRLRGDGSAALFLKIDRGLETVTDPEKGFLKCAVFYLNYFVDQYLRYESEFGKSFKSIRTVVITPSEKRLHHMREAVMANLDF